MSVILPELDEVINTDRAIELCEHFGYTALAERIKKNPEHYKDWKFDGASMVPDDFFAKQFNIPNLIEIALKHDLKYAYGESRNGAEKLQADLEFALDILKDGASPKMAKLMFTAVDIGGVEWLNTDYSWAYAQV